MNAFGRTIFASFTLGIAVAMSGCSTLKVDKPDVWPLNVYEKSDSPTKVSAVWSDTIYYQPNQTPTRGFGGRIMFYEGDKKESVKIDGELTVYAFEEKGEKSEDKVRPDRKFVFTSEELAKHYSKSKIGHSYSVWLPWDDAGGDQKTISLIVRFAPKKGSVLVGDQTKQVLPGATPLEDAKTESVARSIREMTQRNGQPEINTAGAASGGVAPVGYNAAFSGSSAEQAQWASYSSPINAGAAKRMVTTTFDVPPSAGMASANGMGGAPTANGGGVTPASYQEPVLGGQQQPAAQNGAPVMQRPMNAGQRSEPGRRQASFYNQTNNFYQQQPMPQSHQQMNAARPAKPAEENAAREATSRRYGELNLSGLSIRSAPLERQAQASQYAPQAGGRVPTQPCPEGSSCSYPGSLQTATGNGCPVNP